MKSLCLVVTAIAISSCAQDHQRTSLDTPIPNQAMAKRADTTVDTLENGYGVYMRKCGECHIHKLPDDIPDSEWHVVVPSMAWNAGIEPQEEKALLIYLRAAREDMVSGQAISTWR